MHRDLCERFFTFLPGMRRILLLLIFSLAIFVSAAFLPAQDSLSSFGQQASGTNGMESPTSNSPATSSEGARPAAADFGQTGEATGNSSANATLWNRLLLDAFQFGMRSGSLSGAPAGGASFNGGGQGNAAASPSGSEPNRLGNAPGGGSAGLASLFQLAGNLSSDLGARKSGALGTALGVLPAFNQLTREGLNLPLNSSFGNFRLSYRDLFGSGGNTFGANLGSGSPSASFTSSHFKTGKIDFSAAASVSGGSSGGGSGASAGISSFAGQAGVSTSLGAPSGGGMSGNSASGSMGGQSGGTGGGQGGPKGNSGTKGPGASLSLHLSF